MRRQIYFITYNGAVNPRGMILSQMDFTFRYIADAYFFNTDFRDFFRKCDYRGREDRCFVFADPPYLNTDDNYSHSFVEKDSSDLFDILWESGIKWAMSEFDNPFILKQAEERKLNVITIGERTNLMNKRTEILVTNYKSSQLSLF